MRNLALACFVLSSCATPEPTRATSSNDTNDPSAPPPSPSTNATTNDAGTSIADSGAADAIAENPGACTPSSLLAERVGFGAQTKGGDPSVVYHVTTLADSGPGSLRTALESATSHWIVFDVDGTITWTSSDVDMKSNKTLDGRGHAITIVGELKVPAGTHDVILSDVAFNSNKIGDVISVRGHGGATPANFDTHDLWFHHLDLSKGGDGVLDIRGATNVTISWTHVHDHDKAFLHARDTDDVEAPGMQVTYHHNYFEKVSRRSPQLAFGKGDFFNNYEFHWYEFGAASLSNAQLLSEANIYEARPGEYCIAPCPDPNSPTGDSDFVVSKKAIITEIGGSTAGNLRSTNDVKKNGAVITERNASSVFTRPYAATIDQPNDALVQKIKSDSGPRTKCK